MSKGSGASDQRQAQAGDARRSAGTSDARLDRRSFLKASTTAAAALTTGIRVGPAWGATPGSGAGRKKVIVLGFDGMDPGLTEAMMDEGELPNFAKLRADGGYRRLGTTVPPQTPVAFATFTIGANAGHHGIFDFLHRDPSKQYQPMFAAAGMSRAAGYWAVGEHHLPLTFWPFKHEAPTPLLYRKGVPFWDYLDQAGIPTWVYEIPSNFPPSEPPGEQHRALAGMGTPDLLGGYGTYQHFAQNGPYKRIDEGGGFRSRVRFKNDTAEAELLGPTNTFLEKPEGTTIPLTFHRDRHAKAALIEVQDERLLLKEKEWSGWVRLGFRLAMPSFMPDEIVSGICRFYLQEVAPNFRLYVSPINIDPSDPAVQISQPASFVEDLADELGLFFTAGFQEDHKALSNRVFNDEEYAIQTDLVLEERFELLEHALSEFEWGMLFFYFACTDLQAHMFWWDSDAEHPIRSPADARKYHNHIKELYKKMDATVGNVLSRYGDQATLIAMSDHGFATFRRQFNLNRWLRDEGYVGPADCERLRKVGDAEADVDWSRTRAYGLGLNGMYLNLAGRERDGIVQPGAERDRLLGELITKLEAVRDDDGQPVIKKVYRGDEVYSGPETALAPDLVLGYPRGYRISWPSTLGEMPADEPVLSDNKSAWSSDHCMAAEDLPGIVLSNRPLETDQPALEDLAPTILGAFGLERPTTMTGRNIFA